MISAPGSPAASAVIPSAVRIAETGTSARLCSAVGGRLARLRPVALAAHIACMPRWSGSVLSTLCTSRIAETPSTRAWWSLVYIATRPSRRPSMTCASQSGRSQASRVLCRREQSSSSSRTRPGFGSALCRTWCSMSNCSSGTQTSWAPVLIERCGRFRNSGAISSTSRICSYISRTKLRPAPSGFLNSWRPPTCIGMLRFSAIRKPAEVGSIGVATGAPFVGPRSCRGVTGRHKYAVAALFARGFTLDLRARPLRVPGWRAQARAIVALTSVSGVRHGSSVAGVVRSRRLGASRGWWRCPPRRTPTPTPRRCRPRSRTCRWRPRCAPATRATSSSTGSTRTATGATPATRC